MPVEDIAKYLQGEWAVITSAPVAFFAALLVAAWVIWLFVIWTYRARLNNKDAEIQRQDRQLKDYHEKLHGASPDEAKKRIESLEHQIQELTFRKLAREQKQLPESLVRGAPYWSKHHRH